MLYYKGCLFRAADLIFQYGLILSFFAVFLQIAVFLQPLLPKQFQISPVCATISQALQITSEHDHSNPFHAEYQHHLKHQTPDTTHHDHHDANHQCQYCTVYANLVLPPDIGIAEILERTQVRLLFFKQQFAHVFFVLHRLFLLPQGRAPPNFT